MILRTILYIFLFICIYTCQAQVLKQDELWTNDQFRIIMYQDATFSFSKIDEPMKDMIGGNWILRNDTFHLFSADTFRLLLFSLYEQDSIHKKITHVDPRIFNAYKGKFEFPKYFYLKTSYYPSGKICKSYSFASCDETKKCFLDINYFDEKGALIYTFDINLKSQKAVYLEYNAEAFKMPKVIKKIVYKNGKQIGSIRHY